MLKLIIIKPLITLLLLVLSPTLMEGQAQRFKAGIIAGVNASQIDGDRSAGYHKLGLVGGIRGVAILTERTELSLELLYSQRGSQSELFTGNNFIPFKIKIDYIEVPVLYNFLDWPEEVDNETFYKVHLSGGLSYGRLISTTIEDEAPNSSLVRLGDSFKKDDISFTIGATFYSSPHLGFTVRWSRTLGLLFNNNNSPINARSMRGKFLTFHLVYML